eukprot:CAMPEP_0194387062 /NCGR_PEP_ID=MMETSP0174-20130528/89919_1 /TAXON_ID=216777 /ORGANISM="Proboscia alata, Strain PI-D3" /LENGTH=111 /DNA_ID=CAMNT_0039176821 /DNA_START=369 /DNA_END=704 /DNA_ORIENTATION=+
MTTDAIEPDQNSTPESIQREFHHKDYLQASEFLSLLASIAHNNNHFPNLSIERRLDSRRKRWDIVTVVSCRTQVLKGLSFADFHLAMMIDVEVSRSSVNNLVISDQAPYKR